MHQIKRTILMVVALIGSLILPIAALAVDDLDKSLAVAMANHDSRISPRIGAIGIKKTAARARIYEKYEYIGTYEVDRLQRILTSELSVFTDKFSDLIYYPKPRYRVNLYRVTYRSIIPEQDNRPTTASGLVAIPETTATTLPVVSYQHGTVFGKDSVPSNPDDPNYMETRLMVARFASQGYMVVAADYFGKGLSVEVDNYVVKASAQQACLDMLFAAYGVSAKLGIRMGHLYLSGWSQGAWNTLAFLNTLQAMNIPVMAAAVAATPSDPLAMVSRWLHVTADNDPHYVPSPDYLVPLVAMLIHSYEEYYGLPWLSQTAIKPAYQQAARDFYLYKISVIDAMNRLPKKINELLQEDFIAESSLGDNDFYAMLRDNEVYRWRSKTPLHAYYGSADDVIAPYIATLPVEYQKAVGGAAATAIKADIGDAKANHRGAFVYGVEDQGRWFEQLEANTP